MGLRERRLPDLPSRRARLRETETVGPGRARSDSRALVRGRHRRHERRHPRRHPRAGVATPPGSGTGDRYGSCPFASTSDRPFGVTLAVHGRRDSGTRVGSSRRQTERIGVRLVLCSCHRVTDSWFLQSLLMQHGDDGRSDLVTHEIVAREFHVALSSAGSTGEVERGDDEALALVEPVGVLALNA